MNPIQQINALGQSIWLDFIRRDLLETGELQKLIDAGEVRGVTSNPTIFEQAIAEGDLYTQAILEHSKAGLSTEQVFDKIAIADIKAATDTFLPLFESINGEDGFVSIEVNPDLADDTERTLDEARRLWSQVNRPNVMIKIPATPAGIPAIEQATAEGINVNVTLIFSLVRYSEVMEAYLSGLERREEEGKSLDHIASVASFFVSRVDTLVDKLLEDLTASRGPRSDRAEALKGKIAIANVKLAYAQFKAVFESERFEKLRVKGAHVQRPLWASTSTKNPSYPDTLYIDSLIGPHTVNTVPPKTIDAFRDHGKAELTLETGIAEARGHLSALESLGISMDEVTEKLEREGVFKFSASYASLLETIGQKVHAVQKA